MPRRKLLALLFLLIGTSWCQCLLAQEAGVPVHIYHRLSGVNPSGDTLPLVQNALSEVNFTNKPYNAQSKSIKNVITLSLIEERPYYLPVNFTARVKIKIEYGHTSTTVETIAEQVLEISYNKNEGATYNAKQYFHFSDAEYVKVTVLEVSSNPVLSSPDIRNILVLENEIRGTRYPTLPPNLAVTYLAYSNYTDDRVDVHWNWPTQDYRSQLEWAWVETEMESEYKVNGVFNPELLFRNNSTRVELPYNQTLYQVPLLYDGNGRLYYRVRPVTVSQSGIRSVGNWSYISSHAFAGQSPNFNWQSTIAYAEDTKHKIVIQYFDGTLRNRQTVTKDNQTRYTITAEIFYDFQGRPAVEVLPAPGLFYVIQYQKNLNLFNSQSPNTDPAKIFDLDPLVSADDLKMKPTSGASQYYSPSNPEISTRWNKNIPNADSFPYTLTRYTPDGTGRLQSQSGVGAALQMGKGHETKYYYGTAAQEELDGLFGTEVGNYTHYFKTMVQDPNGQMSISYSDMRGRTIATALAGKEPPGMDSLGISNALKYPGQAGTMITRNLLNPASNIAKGNSIESINTLLVPVAALYKFKYTLDPDSTSFPVCPGKGSPVCYDCMYDLEIRITDESGEKETIIFKYNNVNLNADSNCTTPTTGFRPTGSPGATPVYTIQFDTTLMPGSYVIRKTLTLSEASLQKYKEAYLEKGLCKTNTELIDSVYSAMLSGSDCNNPAQLTCNACITALGDSVTFKQNYLQSIGNPTEVPETLLREIRTAYQQARQGCERLCDNISRSLPTKRQLMLSDMMPYTGQYAKGSGSGTLYDQYNIFAPGTPGVKPFYKYPKDKNGNPGPYYTLLNDRDPINDVLGSLTPDNFVQSFNTKWAEALLPYHPEYPKLVFAETNLATSYNWINTFQSTNTYAEAVTKGYIPNGGPPNYPPNNDPFYALDPGARTTMDNWVRDIYIKDQHVSLSMWQLAYGKVKCSNITNLTTRKACYAVAKNPPYANVTDPAQLNEMWRIFRGLYAYEREKHVNQYINVNRPLSTADALANDYILHFPTEAQTVKQFSDNGDWNWWPAQPGSPPNIPPAVLNGMTQTTYTDRCSSYVDTWKKALLQCSALEAHAKKDSLVAVIISKMITVCKKGTDAVNPYGASSVAPNTPNDGTPRSFEEVINSVFASVGIPRNSFCNPFVIEFPKPYGKSPNIIPTSIGIIDTCTCSQFTKIKNQALAAGKDPTRLDSLNKFLLATYGDTMTAVLFEGFSHCNEFGRKTICWTRYDTISYPCNEPNPCSPEGLMARQSTDTSGKSNYTIKKGNPATRIGALSVSNNHVGPCPPGYIWDFILETCVPNEGEPCPPGYVYDYDLGMCVPNSCQAICPVSVCDNVDVYHYPLSSPQPLPDFLKCGAVASTRCLDCATLSQLTLDFKNYFPAPFDAAPVTGSTLSQSDLEYNTLYQRYLNYYTGFNFSWMDYAKAATAASCNLAQPEGNVAATQNVICRDSKPLYDTTGTGFKEPPCQRVYTLAVSLAQQIYERRMETLLADFEAKYRANCMAARNREAFTVDYRSSEYHYTLYYYDLAGNLVKTVPPKGVRPDFSTAFTNSVKSSRLTGTVITRPHELVTQYRYNSLNMVVAQNSPDARTSRFWYDKLGRLVVSQDAKQSAINKYSYTLFDNLGRITEVGQKPQTTAMTQATSQDPALLNTWLSGGGVKEQLTFTVYDEQAPLSNTPVMKPRNLRNRVSYTGTKNLGTDTDFYTATFFTYDTHGNVDTLLQNYKGIAELGDPSGRYKYITYDYDLASGLVKMVNYQPGQEDAFYHRFHYNGENKLVSAYTSRDKIVWERDITYEYYNHGPLARQEYGQMKVQGMDYAFTLQGWLKGMNSTQLDTSTDIGRDGSRQSVIPPDIAGFALHYYDQQYIDYKPIGTAPAAFARPAGGLLRSLYNGNIAAMSVNNGGLLKGAPATTNALPLFYNYQYDQLNRIVSMQAYKGLNAANQWVPVLLDDYREKVTYDPNGNIYTYDRSGSPAAGGQRKMDSLAYNYNATTNQLNQVVDRVPTSPYPEDLESQGVNYYGYDAIGNLTSEGSHTITWTANGKIASINKGSSVISYTYDAAGNRISKTADGKTTIYVRDGFGQVMSIYEKPAGGAIKQIESHLYGNSRIGLAKELTVGRQTVSLASAFLPAKISTFTRGEKLFELSNHLGNVLATVTDKKLQVQSSSTPGNIDHYEAEVVAATDYYPFGSLMPGRKYQAPWATGKYRFGFNGKENDNDVKGEGNQQDYGMRIYDPRIGRFLSVDPITKQYPELTPYQFASNRPIDGIDLDGLEWWYNNALTGWEESKKFKLPIMFTEAEANKYGYYSYAQMNKIKEDFERLQENFAREERYREYNEAVRERNISTNLFGQIYELSGVRGGYQSVNFAVNGQYAAAAITALGAAVDLGPLFRTFGKAYAGVARQIASQFTMEAAWKLGNLARGLILEAKVAGNYISKGYTWLAEVSPFFKTIDFHSITGSIGVSFKTVNAVSDTKFTNIMQNVIDLVNLKNAGVRVYNGIEYEIKEVQLHIAVPKGYDQSKLNEVKKFAESKLGKENVIIFELED